ncbi:MAG TPA: CAP domain-containing protein [Deinococcales bacterium]|nr:CAP domain-containing protein [Deinococcales bacterium]
MLILRRLGLLLLLITLPGARAAGQVASAPHALPQLLVTAAAGLRFTVTPASGPAPLAITLDASDNPDAAGLDVTWSFPDGSSLRGLRVNRTLYKPGKYTITVDVVYPDGRRARGSIAVNALDAGPERARVLALPDTGTEVLFDARSSVIYSPDAVYRWEFGDGTSAEGATAWHSFKAGESTVRLTAVSGGKTLVQTILVKTGALNGNPAFEERVLQLTNAARARGWDCASKSFAGRVSLPPLSRNLALDRAARAQSAAMALAGYFDHVSAVDGSHPAERVSAAGYNWRLTGENIASGQETPEEVVDQWLRSPGHCRNIMSADFREIGISFVLGLNGREFWTQAFGTPR